MANQHCQAQQVGHANSGAQHGNAQAVGGEKLIIPGTFELGDLTDWLAELILITDANQ